MTTGRLIRSALTGESMPMFGTGEQSRDFTYVGDIVAATVEAAWARIQGDEVFNVAGGSETTLRELIDIVGSVCGRMSVLDVQGAARGDVVRTEADTTRARSGFGWTPKVGDRTIVLSS